MKNQKKEMSQRKNRRLVVVDIENAVGAGILDERMVLNEKNRFEETYGANGNDQVVLGVSHTANAFPAKAWSHSRLVMKWGKNGADLALKEVLANENVAERFSEVIVVSGDGIFAEDVSRLRREGVNVTVDSRLESASARLVNAASTINLRTDQNYAARPQRAE